MFFLLNSHQYRTLRRNGHSHLTFGTMALALAAHDHKMPATLKTGSKPTRKTPMTDTDTSTPTQALYNALQQAFDHFNRDLFEGELPHCMITLSSANKTHGYHHSERFVSASGDVIDEIGIHPGYFTLESTEPKTRALRARCDSTMRLIISRFLSRASDGLMANYLKVSCLGKNSYYLSQIKPYSASDQTELTQTKKPS
jgi:hypothetical protein